MRTFRHLRAPLLGLALAACGNAGQSLFVGTPTGAGVSAQVFFDRDGSRSITAGDTAYAGLVVNLVYFNGTDTAGMIWNAIEARLAA